jgi:hypothetical protein
MLPQLKFRLFKSLWIIYMPAPDFPVDGHQVRRRMHKPFRPKDLLRVVEACLGHGNPSRQPKPGSESSLRKSAGS